MQGGAMKVSKCPREPVGLNREESARFVGVSAGLFDAMVADGRMPLPRRAGTRKIWYTGELEQALLALPFDGDSGDNSAIGDTGIWGDVAP